MNLFTKIIVLLLLATPASSSASSQARRAKKTKASDTPKSAKKGAGGQVPAAAVECAETTVSLQQAVTYDTLVLTGFREDQVTWEVSFSSRITKFEFLLPAKDEADMATLAAMLDQAALIPDKSVSESSPDDTQLRMPDVVTDFAGACLNEGSVHVTVPRLVRQLCIGAICRPVLCPLAEVFQVSNLEAVSYAPSNTELLFGSNVFGSNMDCTIVQPTYWTEWVTTKFGGISPFLTLEDYYYMDPDSDGVSNIMEYYGADLMSGLYADINGTNTPATRRLQGGPPISGTDPNNPDTDGDLLGDGFELLYGFDPLIANVVILDDTDGDGLTDFDESRQMTNPNNADTDGDGVSDNDEVNQGSNPNNDKDTEEVKTIDLSLSIGDHSGSHSERYSMTVGPVQHAAPSFGVVNKAIYPFKEGEYTVRVRHRDSNLDSPDYDYTALIDWNGLDVDGDGVDDFEITITDIQGILGIHYESSFDFAAGKSATLQILALGEPCDYPTCAACNANHEDEECEWNQDSKSCKEFSGLLAFFKDDLEDCACEKCKAWAAKEQDTSWIDQLPQCPCTVEPVTDFLGNDWLEVTGDDSWSNDFACNPNNDCGYHEGAHGCLRTSGPDDTRQQCCYGSDRNYIPQGSKAAGTPDRNDGLIDHIYADVVTYDNCCIDCEIPQVCELYIGGFEPDGSPIQGSRSDSRGCL
jgi:hypothetical protein